MEITSCWCNFDGVNFIFVSDMENYYKRKPTTNLSSPTLENDDNDQVPSPSKKSYVEVNLANLPADPGLWNPITNYHHKEREQI